MIPLLFVLAISEEEFEDTKGVIRIRKSKKDRQHTVQKKKDKQRSTKHEDNRSLILSVNLEWLWFYFAFYSLFHTVVENYNTLFYVVINW